MGRSGTERCCDEAVKAGKASRVFSWDESLPLNVLPHPPGKSQRVSFMAGNEN